MKSIINYFFPVKSQWFDIAMVDNNGVYKLVQMRYVLKNNKKSFRIASIGFVNDYTQRAEIYKNTLSIKKN